MNDDKPFKHLPDWLFKPRVIIPVEETPKPEPKFKEAEKVEFKSCDDLYKKLREDGIVK